MIILNYCNNLGIVANFSVTSLNYHNRELATNVEEFLERAAKLKCNNNLELIWEKPKEVELTMQEIADKFNISVEQLKIKK